MRCRCKIILSLVQGKTPTMIAQGGLCAKSQVYRVADRFIEHGLVGLADRREDNGENKVTDAYGMELLRLIEGSPQEHGYRRPTWTQELLILVLAERTGIRVSVTTMCRLLRRLGIRLNRPKPTVDCPWPRSRRTRRLRAIQRLVDNLAPGEVVLYLDEVDIHLNPKIGPEWTLAGKQKYVRTPGCNEKRYLAGALNPKTGKLTWVEGDRKNSLLFLDLLYKLVTKTYRERSSDPSHSRQLRHPRQPTGPTGLEVGRSQQDKAALPATVLPRPQSHRADLEGPARQRDAQPPVHGNGGTHDGSAALPERSQPTWAAHVRPGQCSMNDYVPKSRKAI